MLDLVKIGNKIKGERVNRGISQEELAETLFVSRQAVGKWESGQALPSVDNICLLVTAWGIPFPELLCLNDQSETLSRGQALSEILSGKTDIDIAKELYRFSDEERIAILRAIKSAKRNKEQNNLSNTEVNALWLKLSEAEKQFFDITKFKEEIKNEICSKKK